MNESPQHVTQWCDGLRLNRFHMSLLILAGLTLIFDGYDMMVIAYAMPQIMKEWHLSPVKLGSVASYGYAGLMIGTVALGMIADRVGRRKTLILALSVFSTFSGAAYFAPTFSLFCVLRFFSGLGIGGALPLTITLVSEYAPAKIRGKAVTSAFAGFSLGWVLAAVIAIAVIPVFGWRMLLLMGFLPIFLVPVLAAYLPESVRFLVSKGRYDDAVKELRRVEKGARVAPFNWTQETLIAPAIEGTGSVRDLFSPKLIIMTILVWMTYLLSIMSTTGFLFWVPTLLVQGGFSMARSYSYSAVQSIGAALGPFLIGAFMDKFGRKTGLVITCVLGGISIWLFGNVGSYLAVFVIMAAVGLFQLGAPTCLHVVAGEIYPTRIRSTGIGWALTFGRIGSIVAPILGGLLQMAGLTTRQFFSVFSVPCFVCAFLVLMFRVNVRDQALETITARLTAE